MRVDFHLNDLQIDVVFSELEHAAQLAMKAGDAELASGISILLASALDRYCNRKREQLAQEIEQQPEKRAARLPAASQGS